MFTIVKDSTQTRDNGRWNRVVRLIWSSAIPEEDIPVLLPWWIREQMCSPLGLKELGALLVFGYSTVEMEKQGGFDRGRAVMSTDGLGWLGDGIAIPGQTRIRDEKDVVWFQMNMHFIPEARRISPPEV